MGTEYASRSTFVTSQSWTRFVPYVAPFRVPVQIFGKWNKDLPVYLNFPDCFPYVMVLSVSLDFVKFLYLHISKSPQTWRGHFLLRNTYQLVTYYWLDGSSLWQWNKNQTQAPPVCKYHKKATLLSLIWFWRAVHTFQNSFLLNLFKMSTYWPRQKL